MSHINTRSTSQLKMEASWKEVLQDEFTREYMLALGEFLRHAKQQGKTIYPRASNYFGALNLTPFTDVKVVILGQDPYHGPGQAHGLCFSVAPEIPVPPSLINIYKELSTDLSIPVAEHGCLVSWAMQGVLLLNSVLSVEKKLAASHQGKGWEQFTDKIIAQLNEHAEQVVFILWGSYAQKKGDFINTSKHLVIKAPHPSPLSAYRGFFGHKPFSRTNEYLVSKGIAPIAWQLPDSQVAMEQFQRAQEINLQLAQKS